MFLLVETSTPRFGKKPKDGPEEREAGKDAEKLEFLGAAWTSFPLSARPRNDGVSVVCSHRSL